MPPCRKRRAEEVLEHMMCSMIQTRKCLHLYLKEDEAGDLPHPARNNVPRFTLSLPYKSLFTQLSAQAARLQTRWNNGNGVDRGFEWEYSSFEDPYNTERLPSYQRRLIFRLRNPLIMKQPSKWHIKPVNCNILFYF